MEILGATPIRKSSARPCTHVQYRLPLPPCLQHLPSGLEGVGLLFDGVAHHLPEALGHGKAQVARRDLARVDDAALQVGVGNLTF